MAAVADAGAQRAGEVSFVLDPTLALCRHGALLALRLARHAIVYVTRELWLRLDSPGADCRLAEADDGELPERLAALQRWDRIRLDRHLGELGIHWVADSRRESFVPAGVDKFLVPRYEELRRALDGGDPEVDAAEVWRSAEEELSSDTLALAAALMPYHPLVLARLRSHEREPAVVARLRSGVPGARVTALDDAATWRPDLRDARGWLRQLFLRAGVSELLWSEPGFAAVHLVAPEAVVVPTAEPHAALYYDAPEARAARRVDWWADARAYWYRLDAGAGRAQEGGDG